MQQITNWSDDRVRRLKVLYRDGFSFSLIASDIGVSRNAVIGKAHRLDLPKRIVMVQLKAKRRGIASPRRRRRPPPRTDLLMKPPVIEPIPGHDYRCSIYDLEDCSCRYPLWAANTPHPDRRYCGIPAAQVSFGLSYCHRHTMLCDAAPTPPR